MKHVARVLLLLALCGGCVNHQEITRSWQARPLPAPTPPPPPPVTANQVSRENAHALSQALWDEMDREAQNEQLTESSAKTSPAKK
jgi:hypothetical protein